MKKVKYTRDELISYMEGHLYEQDLEKKHHIRVADALDNFMIALKETGEDARDIYEILIGNYYHDYTWSNVRLFVFNYMTLYDKVNDNFPD
tara:strand:- start:292 stop:564 length:273 start_codon:yes stop_codon:yes gene_type:complete